MVSTKYIRKLTVYTFINRRRELIPEIKLKGQWLKSAGFEAGDMIDLKVENGKLTIIKRTI